MLRRTLIALTAIAALGVGSAAMGAGHGGGRGGGGVGGGGASTGPTVSPSVQGFSKSGPPGTWAKGPAGTWAKGSAGTWAKGPHGKHVFDHRHHRKFLAFGFAGPSFDYGYDSCWRRVPT